MSVRGLHIDTLPAVSRRPDAHPSSIKAVSWWCVAAFLLVALTFAAPINHDEGQYLGAALLTGAHRPFVDFLYLQTPLQPYLSWPIVSAFPGSALIALRCATWGVAMLMLVMVYRACRVCGTSGKAAAGVVVLQATTRTFLFSATVVRNDMLPAAFAAVAILFMLTSLCRNRSAIWRIGCAGLALGLATSTKISYLLLLVAGGAFLLHQCLDKTARKAGMLRVAAYCVGGLLGLLPTVVVWIRAPEAFSYGVFEYAATAPDLWYRSNGYGDRLGLIAKLGDSFAVLALGAGLVALLIVTTDFIRRRRDPAEREARRLLDWLILGGLIAALLPTPTWRQYFLPVFIPLFIRLSLVRWPVGRSGRAMLAALALSGLIGPLPRLKTLWLASVTGHWPLIDARRESRWVGSTMSANEVSGNIVTLSLHAMIDSGVPLDRRFAAGPFTYRTADAIDDDRQRRLNIVSPRTLSRELDREPPAAILVGYESGQNLDRHGLDLPLRAYAETHGFRRFSSPHGEAQLYLAPVMYRRVR